MRFGCRNRILLLQPAIALDHLARLRYFARSVSVIIEPMMMPPINATTTADGQNPITTSARVTWRRKW